jgi:DNA-binding winged helix-turn-helix (wHTH) protein
MQRQGSKLVVFGEFLVDMRTAELFRGGQRVSLQNKPFELLVALLERAGQVVSRAALYDLLWPSEIANRRRSLDTAMKKLRLALSDSSVISIETVPGRGYRLHPGARLVVLSQNGPLSRSTTGRIIPASDHVLR